MFIDYSSKVSKASGVDFSLFLLFLDKSFNAIDTQYERIRAFDKTATNTVKMLNDIHFYVIAANWLNEVLIAFKSLKESKTEVFYDNLWGIIHDYEQYFRDTPNKLRNELEHSSLDVTLSNYWDNPDNVKSDTLYQFSFNPKTEVVRLGTKEYQLGHSKLKQFENELHIFFSKC